MKKKQFIKLSMVQAKNLLKFDNLKHYFFGRNDSRISAYRQLILKSIFPEQVHGNSVAIVSGDRENYFGTDGLITMNLFSLGIKTADCLPIFFYENRKKIIGAVHAGWKGLLSGIIKNALKKIESLGGDRNKIFVATGPHIKSCCYDVPYDRVKMFLKMGLDKKVIANKKRGKWFLSLSQIAKTYFINYGVPSENLETIDICTCCQPEYYSFRREGNNSGRIMSIIKLDRIR